MINIIRKSSIAAAAAAALVPFLAKIASAQEKCFIGDREVPCEEAIQALQQGVGKALGIGIGVIAVIVIIGVVFTAFWLWMLIHAITKPIQNKGLWIILLIIFGVVAAIVYYFVVKRKFVAAPAAPPFR